MVAAVRRRVRHRALVVLLTDLNPSAIDEGLLPVLPELSTSHQVIVAAVSDPRIADMAAGRGDAAQVYDAAAAERSRNDRRGSPRGCGYTGWRSSTRPRTSWPPHWPTATWR